MLSCLAERSRLIARYIDGRLSRCYNFHHHCHSMRVSYTDDESTSTDLKFHVTADWLTAKWLQTLIGLLGMMNMTKSVIGRRLLRYLIRLSESPKSSSDTRVCGIAGCDLSSSPDAIHDSIIHDHPF